MATVDPDVTALYLRGLDFLSSAVETFPDDGWDRPSPCAGWSALDVLGHVGATTSFGIDLLQDREPTWQPGPRPGEAVAGPPKAWWHQLAARAAEVTGTVDPDRRVDKPAGSRSIAEGLAFPTVDLYVHGWDLAHTAGREVGIPAEAIGFAHSVLDPVPPERLRSPATFAPEIPAPPGASATVAFIAWTGRDPD